MLCASSLKPSKPRSPRHNSLSAKKRPGRLLQLRALAKKILARLCEKAMPNKSQLPPAKAGRLASDDSQPECAHCSRVRVAGLRTKARAARGRLRHGRKVRA